MNKDSVRGESTWTCLSLKSEERETRLWAYIEPYVCGRVEGMTNKTGEVYTETNPSGAD
jgi:hypothetical protein